MPQIFRQGEIGEEREDADSHRDSFITVLTTQSFRHEGETEQEDAEHQNSPHAEGDELISVIRMILTRSSSRSDLLRTVIPPKQKKMCLDRKCA